jgi:thioredoxin reductase
LCHGIYRPRQEGEIVMTMCDVAIIGAGPYGLSIAAHLKALGVNFRIFGNPMHTWLEHMPRGMHLKSEGFASSLYDPGSTFTLETYCKEKGIPYAKTGLPVPLAVFAAYGLEFQKRFVPELENTLVTSLQRSAEGFQIRLESGELLAARRVVMAVGLTHYEYVPPALRGLPEEFVTHSSRHNTVDRFKGREVAVVGAGASALDLAALLHQAGAVVQVIARKPTIRFHDPPSGKKPSLIDRLRTPITGIGPGWKLYLCTNAPLLFRQMPLDFRLDKVRRILGPAPCWFIKQQVVGKVTLSVGLNVTGASVQNGRVALQVTDSAGAQKTLAADHVIAATGYKADLQRLTFIAPDIYSAIDAIENTPVLSSNFESSVPGIYFVGATAANTFGPLLRFAYGAGFTAPRIAKHLARSARPASLVREPEKTNEAMDRSEVGVR